MLEFRNLKAEEIYVRVNNVTAKGASFLLYKDARCDMDILDETVGINNWQRSHAENKGNLFCSVGINVNYADPSAPPMWVWKQDCGAESYTEKEKGEASDSFKRACVNWGIGRELYTKIFIFIRLDTEAIGNNKYKLKNPYESFHVSAIEYEGKRITFLEISDKDNIVAFTWGQKKQKTIEDAAKIINDFFPEHQCCHCGAAIEEYLGDKGSVSPERHIKKSKKVYGDIYCIDCIRKGVPNENTD